MVVIGAFQVALSFSCIGNGVISMIHFNKVYYLVVLGNACCPIYETVARQKLKLLTLTSAWHEMKSFFLYSRLWVVCYINWVVLGCTTIS